MGFSTRLRSMTNQIAHDVDRPKLEIGRSRADGLTANSHMTVLLQNKVVTARRLFDEAEHMMDTPGAVGAVYSRAIDEKITWGNSILTLVDKALSPD
jgi:hypothetical protein